MRGEQAGVGVRRAAVLVPPRSGAAPRRWRRNSSITVSGFAGACSAWNRACTAATRAAVRGRAPDSTGPHHAGHHTQRLASARRRSAAARRPPPPRPCCAPRPRPARAAPARMRVHGQQSGAERNAVLQRHVHKPRHRLAADVFVMIRVAAHDAAERDEAVEVPRARARRCGCACASSSAPATSRISCVAPASARMRAAPHRSCRLPHRGSRARARSADAAADLPGAALRERRVRGAHAPLRDRPLLDDVEPVAFQARRSCGACWTAGPCRCTPRSSRICAPMP